MIATPRIGYLMKCIIAAGSGTRLILLLSLFVFGLQICSAEDEIHKDNIVVILDASGSMQEKFSSDQTKSKMEAAKVALLEVLSKVPDDTHIGLLVFSGANIQSEWVYPLGAKDTQKLTAAIQLPQPSGNTPLGRYIRIGANRLLEQREKQYNYGNYRLLVVTDGKASDADKVRHYTPEILNRQIRIDVIGVDMQTDHMLAKVVDSYRKADNPGELVAAVSQILAETGDTGTDVGGEDAFEYIAPLSDEIAADLIQRLTTPPSNTAIAVKQTEPTPKQTTTPRQTPTPQRQGTESQGLPWFVIVLVVIAVVGFLVFRNRK
ncbi:VWA domain-containing protein [Candidatus Poribacteria bacterium]|nr:VWA domain-containing protein [Candidatus Poribacteria bacterium]